jgi:hypothetical protein
MLVPAGIAVLLFRRRRIGGLRAQVEGAIALTGQLESRLVAINGGLQIQPTVIGLSGAPTRSPTVAPIDPAARVAAGGAAGVVVVIP